MDKLVNIENLTSFVDTYKYVLLGLTSFAGLLFISKRFYFNGGYFRDTTTRLDGKTVVITGANTGIGKETAIDLARRGARIILACRDIPKATATADLIRQLTGNGNIVVESLDLASMDSIRKFAAKILNQEERIDILINNAGIMACPKWKTADGFEMQFGTNHLGHFLLTNLLLDKIKSSQPSRIINVSSLAYKRGRMNWNDLQFEKGYGPWTVYQQSKLSNILFTRELAKRLADTNVTVNALHPGVVRTELSRHFGESYGLKHTIFSIFFYPLSLLIQKSAVQGAQTSIYLAVSPDLNNESGFYFADCKKETLLPHAANEEDAQKLWKISEELCGCKSQMK